MGRSFGAKLKGNFDFDDYDYIIPVPLHKRKQRQRGFNQSEEIAKGIQEHTSLPINTDIIKRVVDTKTQTGKRKLNRLFSLRGAFQLSNQGHIVEDKNIILVDDIITTGATITEIAELLSQKGAKKIAILSVAAAMR